MQICKVDFAKFNKNVMGWHKKRQIVNGFAANRSYTTDVRTHY